MTLRSHPLFAEDPAGGGGTAVADPAEKVGNETDWRADLPDDIRDHASLKDVDGVGALAKMFIHAEDMVGRDKVVVPTKTSTDEERRAFYTSIGCPEKVDGYELPTEGMPENVSLDEAQAKLFMAEAHAMGLTKQQAAQIIRFDASRHATALTQLDETQTKARAEAEQTLKKDFGDAYDQNIALAKRAISELGSESLAKALTESGFGDHPDMVKMMAKVGKFIAEDNIVGAGPQSFELSPGDAQAQIAAKKTDKDFMDDYIDTTGTRPGHKAAVAEMERLFKIAYPKAAVAG